MVIPAQRAGGDPHSRPRGKWFHLLGDVRPELRPPERGHSNPQAIDENGLWSFSSEGRKHRSPDFRAQGQYPGMEGERSGIGAQATGTGGVGELAPHPPQGPSPFIRRPVERVGKLPGRVGTSGSRPWILAVDQQPGCNRRLRTGASNGTEAAEGVAGGYAVWQPWIGVPGSPFNKGLATAPHSPSGTSGSTSPLESTLF